MGHLWVYIERESATTTSANTRNELGLGVSNQSYKDMSYQEMVSKESLGKV